MKRQNRKDDYGSLYKIGDSECEDKIDLEKSDNINAGKKDISEAFLGEGIPFYDQEREAFVTCEKILQVIQKPESAEDLSARLNQIPLYSYFVKLRSRLKLLLQEDPIMKDKFYRLGFFLTDQREKTEEVKLGILLLGFYDNEKVKRLFCKLGSLGEYTLYVLEAAKDFAGFNSFVFELVKHTVGYGKMAALSVLQPVTGEMKEWILHHGAENDVVPNLSAILSLEKADMIRFFTDLRLNAENYSDISRLLVYALESSSLESFFIGLPIAQKYLDRAPELAKNFMDFSAILVIYRSMTGQEKNSEHPDTGWTPELEKIIASKCYNMIHQKRWESVILNAMHEAEQPVTLILSALSALQITPPFQNFLPMLQKHPFDFDLFHFLIYDNLFYYTEDVFHYAEAIWPDDIFQGALDLAQEDLNPSFEPDFCLCFLLKALHYSSIYHEAFCLRCLSCRLPDCRKETIRCLRNFRAHWSSAVIPTLESACQKEPTKNIRKNYLRLLGKKEEYPPKEQRYVELPDSLPEPEEGDICLFQTRVAGAFYRDLMAVEGVLEENDLLYLVREPENPYDGNAILVTTDDGYVLGYIPKLENPMPAALMDSGKQLYAFLEEINLNRSQLEVSVILKRPTNAPDSRNPFLTVVKGGKDLS